MNCNLKYYVATRGLIELLFRILEILKWILWNRDGFWYILYYLLHKIWEKLIVLIEILTEVFILNGMLTTNVLIISHVSWDIIEKKYCRHVFEIVLLLEMLVTLLGHKLDRFDARNITWGFSWLFITVGIWNGFFNNWSYSNDYHNNNIYIILMLHCDFSLHIFCSSSDSFSVYHVWINS